MRIFCALILVLAVVGSNAQSELVLFNSPNVHQSSYTNVTARSQYKFSLALPILSGAYMGVSNTGFSVMKDLIDSISGEKWYLSPGFIDKMKKRNVAYYGFNFDLFSLRVKWRRSFVTVNLTDRFDFRFMYPKDLFGIVRDGNAQYIGSEAVFSDLRLNSSYYRELGVGITKEINKKWEYGYRVKLLFGLANVHTSRSTTTLKVGADQNDANALELKSDVVINTSYPDPDKLNNTSDYVRAAMGLKNLGLGLDLGTKYNINKRLSASLAVNNLGFIRWRENTTNQRLAGNVRFTGIEFNDINESDSSKLNLNAYLDSLGKKFTFDSTRRGYTQSLVASTHLNFTYHVFRNTYLNALLYADYFRQIRPAVSVSLYQGIARWFGVNVAWSAQHGKFDNLGLGFFFKPGPLQIFVMSDNLTPFIKAGGLNGEIDYAKIDVKNLNVRFGCNIVLGRVKTEDSQTYAD